MADEAKDPRPPWLTSRYRRVRVVFYLAFAVANGAACWQVFAAGSSWSAAWLSLASVAVMGGGFVALRRMRRAAFREPVPPFMQAPK